MLRSFPRFWMLVALNALIVAVGTVCGWHLADMAQRQTREDLMRQAQLLSLALDCEQIRGLSGGKGDLDSPGYQTLKSQFIAIRRAAPKWRFIYLMGRRDAETVFFYVDSEPADSPSYSYPGQPYEEASAAIQHVFDSGEESLEGPIPDRWGTWISAFVPIMDPQTNTPQAVLGVDLDATVRIQLLLPFALPVIVLTALLVALTTGFFVIRQRTKRFESLEAWTVGVAGLILTLTATWIVHIHDRVDRQNVFYELAHSYAAGIGEIFGGMAHSWLEGLGLLLEESPTASRSAIANYSGALRGNSGIQALVWIPYVPPEDRARVEQDAQAQGISGFGIWRTGADGQRVPVPANEIAYPVFTAEPIHRNEEAIGYDLGSESETRQAIDRAMATGLVTSAEPPPVLRGQDPGAGILVFRPVFEKLDPHRPRGLVAAVLHLGNALEFEKRAQPEQHTISLQLFRVMEQDPRELLASSPRLSTGDSPQPLFSFSFPILEFSQSFLLVARPAPAFVSAYPVRLPWIVFGAGILVTLVVSWLVSMTTAHRGRLERLIVRRTLSLQDSKQRLRLIIQSMNHVVFVLDQDGLFLRYYHPPKATLLPMDESPLGKHMDEVGLPEDAHGALRRALSEAATAGDMSTVEFHHDSPAQPRWLELSVTCFEDVERRGTAWTCVVRDCTERKRAEEALELQLQLRKLMMEISSKYINLPVGALESAIQDSLGEMASFVGADRAYIFQYDFENETCSNTHEWYNDRVTPQIDLLQEVPLAAVPDWVETHLRGEPMYIPDVLALPKCRLRDILAPQDIKSLLAVPMRVNDSCIGFVGFDSVLHHHLYSEDELNLLGIFAQMLVNIQLRKQSEETLRNRTATLGDIIAGTNAGTWEWNILTGETTFNARWAEIVGCALEELAPTTVDTWLQFCYPGDLAHLNRLLELHFSGHSPQFDCEYRMMHKNGSWVWVHDRGRITHRSATEEPMRMTGMHIDITARILAAETLRKSEERYRSIFESMLDVYFETSPEGIVVEVSPSVSDMLGYARESVIGKAMTDAWFLAPKQTPSPDALSPGKHVADYEITLKHAEGRAVVCSLNMRPLSGEAGSLIKVVGTMRDITARKQIESRIRTEAIQRELILRGIGNGIIVIDLNHTILLTNDVAEDLLFAKTPQTGTVTLEEFLDEEILPKADLLAVLQEQAVDRIWELSFPAPRTLRVTSSPYADESGRHAGHVLIFHDITKEREVDRMKTNFVSSVSHELRLPLTSIKGFAATLLRDPDMLPERRASFLDIIAEEANHLHLLVEDILEISRLESGKIVLHSVRVTPELFVRQMLAGMRLEAERLNITLNVSVAAHLQPFYCDPGKTRAILLNLLGNALKFTVSGGTVEVEVHQDDHWMVFRVSDTGVGILPADLPHVFERFFRGQYPGARVGGTGLGLAIAKELVEFQGGGIEVESTVGKGTIFTVRLPANLNLSDLQ